MNNFKKTQGTTRPFSLPLYVLIVCLLSWPFQFAYAFLGEAFRPILLISMIMVTVGTYISGRYVFRDGFADAGWSWGKPRYYVMAFGLALFLWLVPSLIEQAFGLYTAKQTVSIATLFTVFVTNFFITLIPAFGEEFGWRGYMLPRLLKQYSTRKALLLHGFVTWFWHLPFIVLMSMEVPGNPFITIPAVMAISFIPTVLHAVVFAYLWSVSGSIAVVTVYHSAFDETRDTIGQNIGFGPLTDPWQSISLTVIGLILLWKAKWQTPPNVKLGKKDVIV